MYIIHLASEFSSIAKVGGLGDVTLGLSHALTKRGEQTTVILPFYDHINRNTLHDLQVEYEHLISYENGKKYKNRVWSTKVHDITILLIELQNNYFKRGVIYGERDDTLRFVYFTYVAMEYLLQTNTHPNILHLHDWHTALAAPLYYGKYQGLGVKIGGIVITIHNIKYQGSCSPKILSHVGFDLTSLSTQKALQDYKDHNKINLLKGGLLYSDGITTVSPSYAEEIQRKEEGGLSQYLRGRKNFIGILNGIDMQYWNPQTDPFLKQNYPSYPISFNKIRDAKKNNRTALNNILKTNYSPTTPLFACITRLVQQKGPKLIHFGIEYIIKKGGQFILLASTPEEDLKKNFFSLAEKYRTNPHFFFHPVFDERIAHLTFAASDCILIPSLFEPCGLTQMIALRYGTIPIVHAVGGLKDTIFDVDQDIYPLNQRNGYTFDCPANKSLQNSIDRALDHYHHDQKKWQCILNNGLSNDWSWTTPSMKYLALYEVVAKQH